MGRKSPDLYKKLGKGLGAKGQLGQRPSRGLNYSGLVQETVGSTCVCVVESGVLGVCGAGKGIVRLERYLRG